MAAVSRMWPLGTGNLARATEEIHFKLYGYGLDSTAYGTLSSLQKVLLGSTGVEQG